ncbi:sulfite exporter TauE/SafE family protein [Georgenia alba]|uniref:Probable membrane transporter protein n=1 Tax=Georgenia alba TaxID=2233858 RepID=A0ABW2QAN3_9MICO
MAELFTLSALALAVVSFGVGIVVGLTGMGGGALMTPALIFLGIPATAAVANDLVAAAVNKSVGAAVHWKSGSPNLRLVLWLIVGSVPTAFAGAFIIESVGGEDHGDSFVTVAIGVALLLAASTYVLRLVISLRRQGGPALDADPPVRPVPTVVVGAIGGLLVGLTSVGSGSIIMVALLLLYPLLSPVRIVGTDLVQAIPLVIAASVSHVIVTGVDWGVLIPLLVGGPVGTFLGARLAVVVPQMVIRRGIVLVLTLTGLSLLDVPPVAVGILGAAFLILGPAAWELLKRRINPRAEETGY